MAEYFISKKPKDLKDILDYLVEKQIDGSLSNSDDIEKISREIMDMIDYIVKNNPYDIDTQNEIRHLMMSASQLNSYYDKKYSEEECKN